MFRMAHLGEMPEQMNANVQAIGQLQAQFETVSDKLAQLESQKLMIENAPETDPALRGGSGSNPAVVLRTLLSQEQAHLTDLLAHATAAHPDVIASQGKIEELKKQLNAMHTSTGDAGDRSLNARLQVLEKERTHLVNEQSAIRSRLDSYQSKVDAVPLRQEQLSGLTRDYETARDHYARSLKSTTRRAWRASSNPGRMRRDLKFLTWQLRRSILLEPNRRFLWALSALAALAGAFVLAYGRECLDNSVKTEADLLKVLPSDVELLGLISSISSHPSPSSQRVFEAG